MLETSGFFQALFTSSPSDLEQLTLEQRQQFEEAHWNTVLDRPGPRSVQRVPNPVEIWWSQRLRAPASAIHRSFDHLLDVEVYVRRFQYRGTRVTPIGYLSHNVRVYIQETFVLRERLLGFLNTFEKDYKGTDIGNRITDLNGPLCRWIKQQLKPITDARTEHIHKLGYEDLGLSRVAMLELLARPIDLDDGAIDQTSRMYGMLHDEAYRKQRKLWHKAIREWNSTVEAVLDKYFKIIHKTLFDATGQLTFPPLPVV